jgi:hypothetical protein
VSKYLEGDLLQIDLQSPRFGLAKLCIRWASATTTDGDWAQPGDPSLHSVLEKCRASGQEVEIATGSAPGWTNPWSRSVRVQIVSFDFMMVTVPSNETWTIPRDEIQAIRVVAQTQDC